LINIRAVNIRKRLNGDTKGMSKDAPALWAAQRKYEEKPEVGVNEEKVWM